MPQDHTVTHETSVTINEHFQIFFVRVLNKTKKITVIFFEKISQCFPSNYERMKLNTSNCLQHTNFLKPLRLELKKIFLVL